LHATILDESVAVRLARTVRQKTQRVYRYKEPYRPEREGLPANPERSKTGGGDTRNSKRNFALSRFERKPQPPCAGIRFALPSSTFHARLPAMPLIHWQVAGELRQLMAVGWIR